jgi:hypothetical protein
MRVKVLVSSTVVALALSLAGPVFAQEYVEFRSLQDGVGVTFPVQPTVTEMTITSQFGSMLPARVYAAESLAGKFKLTVIDYNNIEAIATEKAKTCPPGAETCRGGGSSTGPGYWKADIQGAVIWATWAIMEREGVKVTYFGWNNIDLVEGHMLYVTNPDRSRTSAGIYMHENKLYILEGTVPAGRPDPGFFQQSVQWLDANGNGIRYQTTYHNGFPKPATGRGGAGGGQGQGQGQGGRGGNAGPGGQAPQ